MKNIALIVILNFTFILISSAQKDQNRKKIEIETKFGNMIIELYNETPKHRDNFIKLISDNYYNDLIFHRVINGFMIQGGDPNSRNAEPNQQLGNGGPNYTIDAEIIPQYFHKKGALAAARQGDNVNPMKKSSGSQFYIVQGKTYSKEQLVAAQNRTNQNQIQSLTKQYISQNPEIAKQLNSLQESKQYDSINSIIQQIMNTVQNSSNFEAQTYSNDQINSYSTLGGTPHLDGAYTVFGEVVKGLNIIDSVAAQPVGKGDRPLNDIKMKIKLIE